MQQDDNKIAVNLYGGKSIFGGKESPLRAEIIYCDNCKNCSLYKDGLCLRVTSSFNRTTCKFGKVEKITGYTSKAKKYYEFKNCYTQDITYNKLDYPNYRLIGDLGDCVFLNLKIVEIKKSDLPSEYNLRVPFGLCDNSFIPKEDFEDLTMDGLLYKIFTFKPRTLFDHAPIQNYNKDILPDLVMQFKNVFPELAQRFFDLYSDFNYNPNYIGKQAYIKTLMRGTKLTDCHGHVFVLEGDKLKCTNYHVFLPFGAKNAEMVIPLVGDEICEVKDNVWVGPETKFK